MSDTRSMVTALWLSGSWRFFWYSFPANSCHFFLISSASVRSIPFLSLSSPSLHEVIPWYLSFSWRDLESFPLCCFPLVLCTVRSWRLSYHSLLFFGTMLSAAYIFHFLLCFSLLFTAICKASSESDFAFLPFFFLGMVLIPVSVQCHEPLSIVHQALYQI